MTPSGILIVEDENIVARDIQHQLLALGYQPVAIAGSGEEAVALAESLRPQLVLMDIHLASTMSGIDAAIAIRERFSIPSVFLTAYASDDVVQQAKAADPLGYIIKPFDEHYLRTAVEIALHKDKLDRQLRSSESRYRAVVRSAHDAVVTIDSSNLIVGWSPSATAIFGYAEEEALGQPLMLLIPARYQERHLAGMQRMSSGGTPPDMPVRQLEGLCKDGTELPVELSLSKWEGPGGWFVTAFMRDVSEKKRADASLRLQSAALNAAANAIVITDQDGTIEWANPAFTTLNGYTLGEAVGKNPRELVKSGVHPQPFYEQMWQTLTAGVVWDGELTNRRKDGTLYLGAQTITPVRDSGGAIAHYVGVTRDLTEQGRLREQLTQAQKMEVVGRLAGGIAHDFNNLLTVINGTADIALMDLPDGDPMREEFEHIQEAGDRAAQLTRQLLAFSRKQVLSPVTLNLSTHVSNISRLLQRMIGEDITLDINLATELETVLADPGQIEQVILNLAVNARDAMPAGGSLTITTGNVMLDAAFVAAHPDATAGPHVLTTVTDTGIGMPPEVVAHIFEPFFTTKSQGKGTGLGLATVYGIVKQSRGFVVVSSTPKGTTFEMYLPVAAAGATATAPQPKTAPTSGTETILLAEDEDALRALAARMLRESGYEVIATRSGEEALERLKNHDGPMDLLFTDVVMTGMTGLQLAREARAVRPGIRVLFSSGYSDERVSKEVANDARYFIAKPYTVKALATKVREVLDGI